MDERMPCVQIETDLWAVMRYRFEQPAAMIMRVIDRRQVSRFRLMTWHTEPSRRLLISMHGALEESNEQVKRGIDRRKNRPQERPVGRTDWIHATALP